MQRKIMKKYILIIFTETKIMMKILTKLLLNSKIMMEILIATDMLSMIV